MIDEKDVLLKRLTERMMRNVYHSFTACVWLDHDGEVLDVFQFDTEFCEPAWNTPDGASECWLISNHYGGNMRPFPMDMRNWQRLKAKAPDVKCRLLIYSEDGGICEMAQR